MNEKTVFQMRTEILKIVWKFLLTGINQRPNHRKSDLT